jgi:ribosome-associated translation inhibitor RaiA
MIYQISKQTKHTTVPAAFDDFVDQELDKLVPILASYPDETMLRVVVEDASGTDDVEVQLRLSLPQKMLSSRETGAATTLNSVFERALKEIRRQVISVKDN